jgi:acetyltransferase-like isoleucine patch superfamily enzyme
MRLVGLICAALLPGFLKRAVYRWCFGYRIGKNVRIGLAYLDCEQLEIGDHTRLGHGLVFWRCGKVRIGEYVSIGPLNIFRGGQRIEIDDWALVLRLNIINAIPENDCTNEPDSSFYLGYGSVVTAEHRIDFTDCVRIGKRTILGGRNSSIWTHNRRTGLKVEIGDYCYLGSEIRMAPGARVPDYCIVGLGAVITRPISEPYSLIIGIPAKPRRGLDEEDYELIFGKTRPDLPDEPEPPRVATVARATVTEIKQARAFK